MAIRYVNTASTPGGDGTTNATTGANRAYASLNEWEAARQAVLSEIEECICEGTTADTTAVTIDGWTTTASFYIYIHTTQANRHDGKWNTGKYRLTPTNDAIALSINELYTVIEGIQISDTTATTNFRYTVYLDTNSGGSVIRNCIIKSSGVVSTNRMGVRLSASISSPVYIINNIIYNYNQTSGVGIYGDAATNIYVYNNTVRDCVTGISTGFQDIIAKNNISYNNTDNYLATFNTSSTNNLSGPSQTDAPGSNPRNGVTITFVDEAGDDFHLASTDAGARDYGTDLSGDANYPFSDDIDGQTRSGTWDIGADEYVAGGGAFNSVPIIMHRKRMRQYVA